MVAKAKIVFSPQVARHLLKRGYKIIDIKPSRENRKKTLFVFEGDKNIGATIAEYAKQKKQNSNIYIGS